MTLTPEQTRAVHELCDRFGVRRLALFGSMLGGGASRQSDIDLLVEFREGRVPGLLKLAEMAADLSDVLGGRAVDLRTPSDLSRHFRDAVLETALELYAA